jgi:hypothetical protein
VAPVTNELSSLARNGMARDTSSGAACRASGMSRGLRGFAADRFGWSLLSVGYRARPPRG